MSDLEYYQHIRREIEPLLPLTAERIVDVGCGAGGTLGWLRQRYPDAYTIGLERDARVRPALERNCSEAHTVDLAADLPNLGCPDLVLCLDVLEHLPDPLPVLKSLVAQLTPTGAVIVSLPNVAHLSVSLPLLLRGEFSYTDAGILDRTHLRFFVQRSAIDLLNEAGLTVQRGLLTGLEGPKTRLVDAFTFGNLRTRLAKQFILLAIRGTSHAQPSISWEPSPRAP